MTRYEGQRWGVIGAGRTGVAAARYLAAEGAEVVLVDDMPDALERVAGKLPEGVGVRPANAVLVSDAERWVISPGVPPTHPLVAAVRDAGRGCSDLDLWQAARSAMTYAVTGTNGKSTVCALLDQMLRSAGHTTVLGANFGTPIGELLLSETRFDRAVLEVSSFQLMYSVAFVPEIAIVTNLAPDHLDWHRDLDEYRAAKERIAARMTPEHLLVVPLELADFAQESVAMRAVVGRDVDLESVARGARIGDDAIRLKFGKRHDTLSLAKIRERVPFVENVALAAFAAWATGASAETLARALADFEPLAHRFETVARRNGVTWINDSKATNLHAMIAAVQTAGESVRLLAGGKEKGLDWASALEDIAGRVVEVYAFGDSAQAIDAAWGGRLRVHVCESLEAAVRVAAADASAGDVVLLAPGTSSFDQFSSYSERGQAFRDVVRTLDEGGSR